MDLLSALLLGHLIADFPLQANCIFRLKNQHWLGVLLHAAVHCVITAVLLQQPLAYWPLLASLCLVHFTIDWFKLRINFQVSIRWIYPGSSGPRLNFATASHLVFWHDGRHSADTAVPRSWMGAGAGPFNVSIYLDRRPGKVYFQAESLVGR